jgi:hypothetical protein
VSHENYNFYNPTQHPFFDQDGGRLIYFEGTYTASFSGAKEKTPRYDYNQIMYRLALDDARLNLPVPVYRVNSANRGSRYLTREGVEREQAWEQIDAVAFFALPPSRGRGGMLPLFANTEHGHVILRDTPPGGDNQPVFFALPPRRLSADALPAEEKSPAVVPLYEYSGADGRREYSTDLPDKDLNRKPICLVWANPMSVLALDPGVKPVPIE